MKKGVGQRFSWIVPRLSARLDGLDQSLIWDRFEDYAPLDGVMRVFHFVNREGWEVNLYSTLDPNIVIEQKFRSSPGGSVWTIRSRDEVTREKKRRWLIPVNFWGGELRFPKEWEKWQKPNEVNSLDHETACQLAKYLVCLVAMSGVGKDECIDRLWKPRTKLEDWINATGDDSCEVMPEVCLDSTREALRVLLHTTRVPRYMGKDGLKIFEDRMIRVRDHIPYNYLADVSHDNFHDHFTRYIFWPRGLFSQERAKGEFIVWRKRMLTKEGKYYGLHRDRAEITLYRAQLHKIPAILGCGETIAWLLNNSISRFSGGQHAQVIYAQAPFEKVDQEYDKSGRPRCEKSVRLAFERYAEYMPRMADWVVRVDTPKSDELLGGVRRVLNVVRQRLK